MTLPLWGAVLGALCASGLILTARRLMVIRKPQLSVRVLPYLRDLPQPSGLITAHTPRAESRSVVTAVFGPILSAAADLVERASGGADSVRRRLRRAGIDKSVHEFRIEQVTWGLVGFAGAAAFGLLRTLSGQSQAAGSLLLCVAGIVGGVLARDSHLTSQAKKREQEITAEFPAIAELLALAVAAGEGPVAALDRVVRRSAGELSRELAGVLATIRTGTPVAVAFDEMSASTGLPMLSRFAQGVAVAVERGTPLADVLHAQAGDVREAGRSQLIETAARKEVFMMVPVVFLVLPITIVFAFYPGAVGLSLTTG